MAHCNVLRPPGPTGIAALPERLVARASAKSRRLFSLAEVTHHQGCPFLARGVSERDGFTHAFPS